MLCKKPSAYSKDHLSSGVTRRHFEKRVLAREGINGGEAMKLYMSKSQQRVQ